eukprot:4425559-Lingulodinium_polyedra.AAC.1
MEPLALVDVLHVPPEGAIDLQEALVGRGVRGAVVVVSQLAALLASREGAAGGECLQVAAAARHGHAQKQDGDADPTVTTPRAVGKAGSGKSTVTHHAASLLATPAAWRPCHLVDTSS